MTGVQTCALPISDGSKTIFSNGILLESVNGKSVASGGSIEVHIYKFLFQNKA